MDPRTGNTSMGWGSGVDPRTSWALSAEVCGCPLELERERVRCDSQPVMRVCQVCFKADRMQNRVYLACGFGCGSDHCPVPPLGGTLWSLFLGLGNVFLGRIGEWRHKAQPRKVSKFP